MFNSFKNLSLFSVSVTPVVDPQPLQQSTDELLNTDETTTNNSNISTNTLDKLSNVVSSSGDTFKMLGSKFSMWTSNVITKIDEERKKLMEESERNEKMNRVMNERLPPWMDFKLDDKENHKEAVDKILDAKMSKKTFLQSPPIESDYCQEFDDFLIQIATASLKYDKQLEKIRFIMVPRYVSEEQFWKNWYYRVTLIRKEFNIIDGLNDRVVKSTAVLKTDADADPDADTPTFSPKQNGDDISNWEKELLNELDGFNNEELVVDLSMNNDLLDDSDNDNQDKNQDNNIDKNQDNNIDNIQNSISNVNNDQTSNEENEKVESKEQEQAQLQEDSDSIDSDTVIDEELKREAELLRLSPPAAVDSDDELMKEIESEIS